MSRTRVAILGGGMAGLTTALELSATPELRDTYEVTIHQLGWRLGGKCATGRNQAVADRIEEHGLHLWFGGYANAFSMLRTCYEQLDRPAHAPIRTLEDAFLPLTYGVLYDHYDGQWCHSVTAMPVNSDRPGDPVPIPGIFDLVETGIDAVLLAIESAEGQGPPHPLSWRHHQSLPSWAQAMMREGEEGLAWLGDEAESGLLHAARAFATVRRHLGGPGDHHRALCRMLDGFRQWFWTHRAQDHLDHTPTRHLFTSIDFFTSVLIGLITDDLLSQGFDTVNDVDLRPWLTRHGARDVTLHGPMVRSLYDESFAQNLGPSVLDLADRSVAGDHDHEGVTAAGAMLLVLVRQLFCYRGAVLYKPRAGFADVVVTPMYELLRSRGVHVEFFHRVDALHLSADRHRVESVALTRQASLAGPDPYQPLLTVEDVTCWPSEPFWDQLEGGSGLAAADVCFEQGDVDPAHAEALTLEMDRDFDVVVLGISAAALPALCGELIDDAGNPRFQSMLAHTHTIMTQAFQLWSTRTLAELGWEYAGTVSSCFIEPLDTYCDMTELLGRETWTAADDARSVGYFCGVLDDAADDSAAAATARARAGATDYLAHITAQWTKAVDPASGAFDWSVLLDREGRTGADRLDAQFVRANFELTERYVQTPPGSVQYRLRPDESGYPNLILTGDWTRTGLDMGCVESAVMSGMLASRAISGFPKTMAREDHLWNT